VRDDGRGKEKLQWYNIRVIRYEPIENYIFILIDIKCMMKSSRSNLFSEVRI
jgi:hypothetical protein